MAKYDSLWALGTIGFMTFSTLLGNLTNRTTDYKKNLLEEKIVLTENVIKDPMARLENLHPNYNFNLKDLDKFNFWIDFTLKESAKNKTNSIIIDKSTNLLYLIKNGKVDSKYNVEIGQREYLDKKRSLDMHTPEGMYIIQKKLPLGHTDWYKALLLNYPNKEDLLKGKTGSAIEIHGKGSGKEIGKGGFNWTWGCSAVSDADMDSIFKYMQQADRTYTGDRVTVVRYTNKILDPEDRALFESFSPSLYKN